jgi:hypothetical protein
MMTAAANVQFELVDGITATPLLTFMVGASSAQIVAGVLRVYFPDAITAVDLTPGNGGFWSARFPTKAAATFSQHDFRRLPYDDATFDVALFDPPHLADAGEGSIMRARFGTYSARELPDVIRAGCREAWRVARLGIVVKLCDHVHGQRYVLESDWAREAIGEPPFGEVHQVRAGAVVDSRWGEQLSAYNNGATYLIWRKDGPLHVRRAA